jgi:hypothetical protein
MNKKLLLILVCTIIVGVGCGASTNQQTAEQGVEQSGQISKTFDTNDYLDQALEDLDAVE